MELLVILLVVPLGLYSLHGRGRGRAWGLLPAGEALRGEGAYRQTRVKTWRRGAAPLSVRIAALSCFFLGQMVVPGVLAALVGMIVLVETLSDPHSSYPILYALLLSAPTGVVVAVRLLSAGSAMLARADDAARKARRAARWALGHNLALLVGLGLAAAVEREEPGFALPPALCACFSIAQALLVQRAAKALDAYSALQDGDPAPIEAELAILHGAR